MRRTKADLTKPCSCGEPTYSKWAEFCHLCWLGHIKRCHLNFSRIRQCRDCGQFLPADKGRCKRCNSLFDERMTALRAKAIAAVGKAVKEGALARPSIFGCADCDRPANVYDHRDYTKPLEVAPVCWSCNNRRGSAKPLFQIEQERLRGC